MWQSVDKMIILRNYSIPRLLLVKYSLRLQALAGSSMKRLTRRRGMRQKMVDEEIVTEMFCPFGRDYFGDNETSNLLKTLLLLYTS